MEFTTVISGEMLGYDENSLQSESSLPLQKPQSLDVIPDVSVSQQLNKTEMKMERMGGKSNFGYISYTLNPLHIYLRTSNDCDTFNIEKYCVITSFQNITETSL